MNIRVDNSSLEISISIFKELRYKSSVSDNTLAEYLNSPGIIFLRKHLKVYGGLEFNERFLKRMIDKTLGNSTINVDDNMLLRSMKLGYEFVEIIDKEFNKIDTYEIVKRAISLVNLHLPAAFDEDIQIYFLCGIRGTGIVLGNEIAIDVCDEYVNKNGIIDIESLVGILAHELHHIAINRYLFIKQRGKENEKVQRLEIFLGDLASEGLAYYYLPSPYDRGGMISEKWSDNIKNIDGIIGEINNYIDKILDGTLVDLKETSYLFSDDLKGYVAGYEMIRIMDEKFGKDKVFEFIKDSFLFLKRYRQAFEEKSINWY